MASGSDDSGIGRRKGTGRMFLRQKKLELNVGWYKLGDDGASVKQIKLQCVAMSRNYAITKAKLH